MQVGQDQKTPDSIVFLRNSPQISKYWLTTGTKKKGVITCLMLTT